jgi:hypothetical protein
MSKFGDLRPSAASVNEFVGNIIKKIRSDTFRLLGISWSAL